MTPEFHLRGPQDGVQEALRYMHDVEVAQLECDDEAMAHERKEWCYEGQQKWKILGTGAKVAKRVQKAFTCQIKVHQENNTKLTCWGSVDDQRGVEAFYNGIVLGSLPTGSETLVASRLFIPPYKAGAILGPQGATLKEIEWVTDTTIQIEPISQEQKLREILIIGHPESIVAAKSLVNNVVTKVNDSVSILIFCYCICAPTAILFAPTRHCITIKWITGHWGLKQKDCGFVFCFFNKHTEATWTSTQDERQQLNDNVDNALHISIAPSPNIFKINLHILLTNLTFSHSCSVLVISVSGLLESKGQHTLFRSRGATCGIDAERGCNLDLCSSPSQTHSLQRPAAGQEAAGQGHGQGRGLAQGRWHGQGPGQGQGNWRSQGPGQGQEQGQAEPDQSAHPHLPPQGHYLL